MTPNVVQRIVSPISGQTRGEEALNTLLHGIGLALSIGGTAVLIVFASLYGNAWHIVTFSVYGATLVLFFCASTLYHAVARPRPKRVLQVLDHAGIFLLIAGTYTPFTLVSLNGGWGWSLFGVIWGLASAGIVLKCWFVGRFDFLSTLLYLGMGWLVLVAIVPLWRTLPLAGFFWLVAGGVVYSAGTVFYLWERLPFSHAVWHGFVLAGGACHYVAVLFFVLGPW
jgi:hemolysin III